MLLVGKQAYKFYFQGGLCLHLTWSDLQTKRPVKQKRKVVVVLAAAAAAANRTVAVLQ